MVRRTLADVMGQACGQTVHRLGTDGYNPVLRKQKAADPRAAAFLTDRRMNRRSGGTQAVSPSTETLTSMVTSVCRLTLTV